jgi:hypothetical protein
MMLGWCCRTAHNQQSTCCLSAVTPQRAIINIAVQAVCYTNELAAGYKIHVHLLMMLARFGAGRSPAVNMLSLSAVTPQRAIINIAEAVCYTNELAAGGTKFM